MTPPACTLLGFGTALPPHSASQADAAALVGRLGPPPGDAGNAGRRRIAALYRKTGVRRRHSVLLTDSDDGADPSRLPFYPPGEVGPTTAARMAAYAEARPPARRPRRRRGVGGRGRRTGAGDAARHRQLHRVRGPGGGLPSH